MDHPRIDDEKIVDRYLTRRLEPDEEAAFEEHLFECAACLENVEAGEDLRRGLRTVAAEDAARAVVGLGLAAWLRRLAPAQRAGLAILVLAPLLFSAFLVRQYFALRDELDRLQATVSVSGPRKPWGHLLAVSLGAVREAGDEAEVRVDDRQEAVLFSLELPPDAADRYRATLRDAAGEVLWQEDDLTPSLYDSLLVLLPARFLQPGSYRITLEGPDGAPSELRFRVLADSDSSK